MLYGSNGRRFVLTGQMEGAFPFLRDIAWRVQEPARIQETILPRTIFLTIPEPGNCIPPLHSAMIMAFKIQGFYSRFYNRMGVMLSAQMGSEDLLAERIRLGRPLHTDPFARSITYPYQEVTHQTAVGKIRFSMWAVGNLYWQVPGRRMTGRKNVSAAWDPTSRLFPCTCIHFKTPSGGSGIIIHGKRRLGDKSCS